MLSRNLISITCLCAGRRHERLCVLSGSKFLMLDDGDYLVTVEPRVKAAMGRDFSVYRSEPFFLEVMPKELTRPSLWGGF